jgi:hypothetical protein
LLVEKKIREPIKSLRFNRGGKYTSMAFIKFCKKTWHSIRIDPTSYFTSKWHFKMEELYSFKTNQEYVSP